jgi:hypothetical protein
VETGNENVACFGRAVCFYRSHIDYLAGLGACAQTFVYFALNLATAAGDAFFLILKNGINAHYSLPEIIPDLCKQ